MRRNSYLKVKSVYKKLPVINHNSEMKCDDNKMRFKTLIINGDKYRTTFNNKFEKRKKWIKPDEKKVISFIPCTIIKVFAKEGQRATRNDEMLILEAMKMQNTFYFPVSGRIKRVNIKAGDKIPKGFVMVEYE